MSTQFSGVWGGTLKCFLRVFILGMTWASLPLFSQPPATDRVSIIQQHWEDELGPAARDLKAASQNGVVSVSGTVNNLVLHDKAIQLAGSVPGVTQIVDQITVRPEVRPDAAVQEDVQRALQSDPVLQNLNPQVIVSQGRVTLSGHTHSVAEKQLAQEVVKGVRGVGQIQNDLVSQPLVPPPDFEVATDLRRLLKSERSLASNNVGVRVVNGQATLNGAVNTLADKERATQLALSTGAAAVDNSMLQVRPEGAQPSATAEAVGGHGPPYMVEQGAGRSSATDKELEKRVKENLRNDPSLCRQKLNVRVEGGRAFITGRVKNIDHQAAVFCDAFIAGVSRVDMSGLTVEQKPPQGFSTEVQALYPEWMTQANTTTGSAGPAVNDQAITEAVRVAILNDPRVSPYMINISSEIGTVILTGGVDNLRAKRLASAQAAQIVGVTQVDNRLVVYPKGKPVDQVVADNAQAALARDPVLAGGQFQVAVQQGHAVLSGTANSDFVRARAEDIVAGLNGVLSMQDDIKLNAGS